MFAIPPKRANAVAFKDQLESFLKKHHGDDLAKYQEDINALHQLRQAATSVTTSLDNQGVQNIARYNYHLKFLVQRLAGYETETKFTFTWTDAFVPTKKVTNSSLYFEWASLLWNMASFESNKGASMDRSKEDGIRQALKCFQQAAGIYDFIMSNVLPNIPPQCGQRNPEISEDGMQVAKKLMLAQAQTCFYEKAVKDRKAGTMKANIVAKLAMQIATLYNDTLVALRQSVMVTVMDSSWVHHLEYQRICFTGAAEYWQSMANKEDALKNGTGFGEEIARLSKAEVVLNDAISYAKRNKIGAALLDNGNTLLRAIQSNKTSAENDNRMIYHETIPTSFAPIAGVCMVKPADMPEFYCKEPPLLQNFASKAVSNMLALYATQAEEACRNATTTANNETNSGRTTLSSFGLPGSLELYKSGGEFPENLWAKIERVQSFGGMRELNNKIDQLSAASLRARNVVDDIRNSIHREEQLDESFRARHRNTANLPSTTTLVQELRHNLQALEQTLREAKAKDEEIASQLKDKQFLAQISALCKPRADVVAMLPKPSGSNAAIDTSVLEEKLVELADVFTQREQTLQSLKSISEKDMTDSVFQKCSTYGPTLSEEQQQSILSELMSAFQQPMERLRSLSSQQAKLIREISDANTVFCNDRQTDTLTAERDRTIRFFEEGIAQYFALYSKLNAGVTFYNNIQSRLAALNQQANDLWCSQSIIRQEIEEASLHEHNRYTQEASDAEMARKLAEEFQTKATTTPNAAPTPPAPAASQYGSGSSQYAGGAPMSGAPSPSLVTTYYQQNAPQGVAYGNPIPPPNTSQAPTHHVHVPGAPPAYSPHASAPTITSYTPQQQQQQQHQYPPQQPPGYQLNPPYGYPGPSAQQHQSGLVPQHAYGHPSTGYSAHQSSGYPPAPNFGGYPSVGGPGQYNSPPQQNYIDPKRLVEMGFAPAAVAQALAANNGSEEAALNSLLAGDGNVPPQQTPNQQQPPNQQQQPAQANSFFGFKWGK